ncbi:L-fuculokinase [Histophilus somni]|uniref:L-fuculokinase n=1 Tax=Histophilus somni TaxID=731 RepID=A0A9Q6YZU8_HISSO|nr:L-fuculokinase [Histophilus somni]ARU65441.1 L-fuculokinase [Histophilus somni]ARU67309.1 L-fuculokinase [Histophilus somni]ARU69188.1 L-fuculokinase [Histophilus somni]ARU71066.1 L-fuculokinase [Histophilus somni]ARU72937.1 L-fuculokinase [Histophilus somni]
MAIALIFDCGATNLRTIAINEAGKIVASHHTPNHTQPDPENSLYHIWDIEEIYQKLIFCAEKTIVNLRQKQIDLAEIKGIGITTFGVDGAPFSKNRKQIFPIISWKCPRTLPVMEKLHQYLDVKKLYQRNGIGQYSFNTLFKLLWLKENKPDIFAEMDKWVFISSILTQRLTGQFSTDRTMAGTSMMTNIENDSWDKEVLDFLGLNEQHFPPMKRAGEKIGNLLPEVAKYLGLSTHIPVLSCGHDTQFAIFGSGAGYNQPVLSSGTWEILMVRTQQAQAQWQYVRDGLTIEFDSLPGAFNPGVQWVSSGVIEWLGKQFFSDVTKEQYYQTMIAEGETVPAGSNGVKLVGNFDGKMEQTGEIKGLSMHTKRGEIYRAGLEYMAYRLKAGLNVLQKVGNFSADRLIVVGGGSKNKLWNQIRADVLGCPIDVIDIAESTVLGAAMFTLTGAGVFANVEEAQQKMKPTFRRIEPSTDMEFYKKLQEDIC